MRVCQACGRVLPLLARPNRRYCGSACRLIGFRQRQRGSGSIRPADLDRLASEAGPLSEHALLLGIQQAARLDWQAAAWVLSHRWPQRWARSPDRVRREPDLLDEPLAGAPHPAG